MNPTEMHVKAADQFCEADNGESDTLLRVAAFGLSIVEDVRAGRVRPINSYEAYTRRVDQIKSSLDYESRTFLAGVTVMVAIAYDCGAA